MSNINSRVNSKNLYILLKNGRFVHIDLLNLVKSVVLIFLQNTIVKSSSHLARVTWCLAALFLFTAQMHEWLPSWRIHGLAA